MTLENLDFQIGVSEAMESLARAKNWMLENDDYETLQWFETESEPPTYEQVQAEILRLRDERETKLFQEKQEIEMAALARESAFAKLSKLGLTEDEIKAVIGF